MQRHTELDRPTLDLPAVAARVGPFPGQAFLSATTAFTGDTIEIVDGGGAALVISPADDAVRLAGDPDLTDYHSPLGGDVARLVAEFAESLSPGTTVDFDSLPAEAMTPVAAGLRGAGMTVTEEQHEAAAIVELPDDFDAYLAALSKKQRHEVRRKLRRFEEAVGLPRLERHEGADAIAMFADMHRRSSGDKGEFMTEAMEHHFLTLHKEVGGSLDVLFAGDRPAAAAFLFEDADTTYLYNSAYEPDIAEASPGVTLVAMLIRGAIASQRTRFDFLKGDEVYKYRMGAVARPLYRLTGVVV